MANPNPGGNRQKSRQQHELDGTFRHDRHGALRSPEPTAGRPDPPEVLSEGAQKAWDDMVAAFEDMGMLYRVDAAALFQYARLYAETEAVAVQQAETEATVKILEENLGDVAPEDKVQLFTQIAMLRKLIAKATDQLRQGRMALRQYLVEFGMTPAARGRVKLPAAAEVEDDFTRRQKLRAV